MVLTAAMLIAGGCARQDQRLQQHRAKLESLAASTALVAEAWLSGQTSGTYTSTALEQVFMLVETERRALSSPALLSDPRGVDLSESAERLSRLLASMIEAVATADAGTVRQQLAAIPNGAPRSR